MHELLKKSLFLVTEHVGMFKAANNYDIYDPRSGAKILECREEGLGFLTRILRFSDSKRMTPFDIRIRTPGGPTLLRVRRGVALFRSTVRVEDEHGLHLGGFKQKLFSIGGRFEILDEHDRPRCTLKGKWTGWDFRFLDGERELAHVTKKWSGFGRELLTTADSYVLKIHDAVPADDPVRMLILGAVMCIDMVLKE